MKKVQLKCRLTVGLILILTLLANQNVFGQFVPKILQLSNEEIRSKTERVDPAGWLYLKQTANLLPGELFSNYKDATGLKANDQMQVNKEWSDKYGWSHVRFQQYYKGLKVEGGEWSEHWKDCYIEIAHGKLIEDLEINENPTISEAQAIDLAMDSINASEYAWQNEDWEQSIKEDLEDPNATYYPEIELLIGHVSGAEFQKESYRLTWKFQIRATNPSSLNEVYIDAHSGEILRLKPVGEENGPATMLFGYGEQTIDTKKRLWYHILKANDNGRNIHTKFGSKDNNFWWRSNITDGDDDWETDHQRGTTAHWVVSESWDYFSDVHGRKGYDDDGERIRVWADSDLPNNAKRYRDGGREYIEFGSIVGGSYLAALDIAGHEFTHGMTDNFAGLEYESESGALNESFSDIFGVSVQRYSTGSLDWLVGEDAIPGGVRSLSNPAASGQSAQPSIYLGPNWFNVVGCTPSRFNDFCGVHTNSGVQNYWFYLLTIGGSQNSVNVTGIGFDNAIDITYYNLSTFMQSNSQYADAREGAINAARIIFGPCSFEEIQTTNAWSACGVGPLFTGPCLELFGPELICIDFFYSEIFTAVDVAGSVFTWTFPPQWTTHTTGVGNRNLVVTDLGYLPPYFPYTVTVSVTSSSGGTESMEVILDDCHIKDPCEKGGMYLISNGEQGSQIGINKESLMKASTISKKGKIIYELDIYPNPSTEFINLQFNPNLTSIKQISIVDIHGKVLKEWESFSNNEKVNISNFISGIYLIRVESGEFLLTKSFIKSD